MIIKEALRSLSYDKVRSFFYWLTFVLTAFFILLFFSIYVTLGETSITTGVTVLVIIICCADIFFANDFFVKAKAKEMAVRLICGATFNYVVGYLFIQTTLLMLVAIPLGVGLTFAALPIMNMVMSLDIVVSGRAVLFAVMMLSFIIFWTVLLNLSFAYKSAAAMMFKGDGSLINGSRQMFNTGLLSAGFFRIVYLLIYLLPVILIYTESVPIIVPVVVGILGLSGMIGSFIVPILDRKIDKKEIDDPDTIAELGLVRNDIRLLKMNILLLAASALILFTLIMMTETNTAQQALVMISYVMMTLLLVLAFMFKYATIQSNRLIHFTILSHIGFQEDAERKMVFFETVKVFLIVFLLCAYYFVNLIIAQILHGDMNMSVMIFSVLGFVLPMLLCWYISYRFYRRSIFGK